MTLTVQQWSAPASSVFKSHSASFTDALSYCIDVPASSSQSTLQLHLQCLYFPLPFYLTGNIILSSLLAMRKELH